MADNKKYYWLKLKEDFFKRQDIMIIEDMDNGKDYVLFYLKLLVQSISQEGKLRFSDTIPYNEKMLATITNTNIDTVRAAIKIFVSLDLIELLDDGTIYISEVNKMIGNETSWAVEKRRQRDKLKQKQIRTISGQCPPEIEIEIEKDIDIDIEIEIEKDTDIDKEKDIKTVKKTLPPSPETKNQIDFEKIMKMYNETCPSLPSINKLTKQRKNKIRSRLKELNNEILTLEAIFKKVESSKFLTGENDRGWKANFDWIIKSEDIITKIQEGRYDNKKTNKDYNLAMNPNSFTAKIERMKEW